MTRRSIILGLLGVAFIAAATYYNDYVINQKWFIGFHLPVVVMGLVLPLALLVNPLLGRLHRSLALSRRELGVVIGLMLVGCALPGSGYWRYFGPTVGLPPHAAKVQPSWQAIEALAYVPGGPQRVAAGQVRDWPGIIEAVRVGRDAATDVADSRLAMGQALWTFTDELGQFSWRDAIERPLDRPLQGDLKDRLRLAMNITLAEPSVMQLPSLAPLVPQLLAEADWQPPQEDPWPVWQVEWVNRRLLSIALPEVMPPPTGSGALLARGQGDSELLRQYLWGEPGAEVPWAQMWTTLRVWVGSGLFLALAILFALMVVHPQWSRRELLPYPIARFVTEVTQRTGSSTLPDVCRSKAFWLGVSLPAFWLLIRGIHTWFPLFPDIPTELAFTPLRQLFPNASRVQWSQFLFEPKVRFGAIGVAYLLPLAVSFTMGTTHFVYVAFAALLLMNGIPLETDVPHAGKFEWIRAGAAFGLLAVIAYEGRRYYGSVVARAVGLPLGDRPPASALWAARATVACLVAATLCYSSSGLAWPWAAAVLTLQLCFSIVTARVMAETGFYFFSAIIAPTSLLLGLFGFETLGPTVVVITAMAGHLLGGNAREAAAPFFINALKLAEPERRRLGERADEAAPSLGTGRYGLVAAVALVLSMGLAGYVTLNIQFERGTSSMAPDSAWQWAGIAPLSRTVSLVREASAFGTLETAVQTEGVARLGHVEPSMQAMRWLGVGLVAVVVLAVLRLRVPGWPIHPLMILLLGGWTIGWLGVSFLLGWAVRFSVMRTAGVKGYRAVLPFMVGMIAGEVTMGLLLAIVGWTYHGLTGLPPTRVPYF